jgi:acyl carrier protein
MSTKVKELLSDCINELVSDLDYLSDFVYDDNPNLLEVFDSMDIVKLIMLVEEKLEDFTKIYIPLADENTFDLELSSFTSLTKLQADVEEKVAEYGE